MKTILALAVALILLAGCAHRAPIEPAPISPVTDGLNRTEPPPPAVEQNVVPPIVRSLVEKTVADAQAALATATKSGDDPAKPCPIDVITLGARLLALDLGEVKGVLSGIALTRAVHHAGTAARPLIDKMDDDCAIYKQSAFDVLRRMGVDVLRLGVDKILP